MRGWVPLLAPEFARLPIPGVLKFADGCEGCNLDPFELTEWVRRGLTSLAGIIRSSIGPFVPNAFQKEILAALEYRGLKKMELAKNVCGGEDCGNLLYRSGGLTELRNYGLVKWKSKLGFYRPDAPPPGTVY